MSLVTTASDFLVSRNDGAGSACLYQCVSDPDDVLACHESTYGYGEKSVSEARKESCASDNLPFRSAALRATLGALALKPMTVLLSQSLMVDTVFCWVWWWPG